MIRIKEHRSAMAKILGDDRLSPNRRFLAEMIALYLDADQPARKNNGVTIDTSKPFDAVQGAADKKFFQNVIIAQFGNAKNIQWLDSQDPDGTYEPPTERIEREAIDTLRQSYDKLLPQVKK